MANTERPSHAAARLLNLLRADRYIALNFADELFQLGSIIDAQDRLALSHAAGQDGEQCRAASGEPDAWLYEYEHDGESDHCLSRVRFLPSWVEAKRATENPLYLRALSRGVPEGETPKRGEATGDTTTFSDAWARLSPIDRAVITGYFERHFSPAIAAQRKEGE